MVHAFRGEFGNDNYPPQHFQSRRQDHTSLLESLLKTFISPRHYQAVVVHCEDQQRTPTKIRVQTGVYENGSFQCWTLVRASESKHFSVQKTADGKNWAPSTSSSGNMAVLDGRACLPLQGQPGDYAGSVRLKSEHLHKRSGPAVNQT